MELKSVPHDQVAQEMGRMNAGIFFVKTGFSSLASMPTKLGEFLACGITCIGNAGIGDVEDILEKNRVGVILREFTSDAETKAVSRLLELLDDPESKNVAQRLLMAILLWIKA